MKLHWIEDDALAAGAIPINVEDIESLHRQGVRAILTLTEHPVTRFDNVNDALFDSLGIAYLHLPIDDHTAPSVEQASQAVQFIKQMSAQNKPVYMHCAAGIGRTGTMLHAYYVMDGLTLDEAKIKVRDAKPSSQYLMLSGVQRIFLEQLARDLHPSMASVLDLWHLPILPDLESEFKQVLTDTERWLLEADGYVRHELRRNREQPSMYLLMIQWGGADYAQQFLDSAGYAAFQRALQPYLMDDPLIEQYE